MVSCGKDIFMVSNVKQVLKDSACKEEEESLTTFLSSSLFRVAQGMGMWGNQGRKRKA